MIIIWWKELRGILPLWLGVLAAMWLPGLLGFRPFGIDYSGWIVVSTVIGGVCLATTVYAREFHDRTMLWQLAQPVSRLSLLGGKIALLLFVLAPVVISVATLQPGGPFDSTEGLLVLGSLLAIALTSVCFWSILTRNMLATAVMTIVIPMLFVGIASGWVEWLGKAFRLSPDEIVIGFLLLYSLLTGIAAVVLWKRMEVRGDAVAISSVDIRWISRLSADRTFKVRSVGVALCRKELGLLRFVLWIAVLFVVAAGVLLFGDVMVAGLVEDALKANGGLRLENTHPALHRSQEILQALGAASFLFHVALVPALCGGLAFAEETYFGTRAWQLCQAVGSGRQWVIKIGTAAGLNLFIGLLLPALVFGVWQAFRTEGTWDPELTGGELSQAACINTMVFAISSWCASWSRTTVAAMAKALLIIMGLLFVNAWSATMSDIGWLDWRIIGWPAAVLALAFTAPNFRSVDMTPRRWVGQLLALAVLSFGIAFVQGMLAAPKFFLLP